MLDTCVVCTCAIYVLFMCEALLWYSTEAPPCGRASSVRVAWRTSHFTRDVAEELLDHRRPGCGVRERDVDALRQPADDGGVEILQACMPHLHAYVACMTTPWRPHRGSHAQACGCRSAARRQRPPLAATAPNRAQHRIKHNCCMCTTGGAGCYLIHRRASGQGRHTYGPGLSGIIPPSRQHRTQTVASRLLAAAKLD